VLGAATAGEVTDSGEKKHLVLPLYYAEYVPKVYLDD
jgi:hypothetical protein